MAKRTWLGASLTVACCLTASVATPAVLNDPVLSPGETKVDHPVTWAPEMGRIPLDIPEGMIAKGIKSGSANIRCHVTVAGSMGECTLLKESPEGSGMGKASLNMASQLLIKPATRDGKPVEVTIDILVPWAPPQGSSVGSNVGKGDMSVGTHTTYSHVVWTTSASYSDLLAALPAKAKAANMAGTVVVRCTLNDAGKLTLCNVTSELPFGYGFGNAALDLVSHFKAPAKGPDGKSVAGAWVTLNVLFPSGMADGSALNVTSAQWIGQPTAQQWASVYPPKAKAAGVTAGSATLSCTVETDGGLKACSVKDETPAGMGFGASRHGRGSGLCHEGME